jgi:hypothetical protein
MGHIDYRRKTRAEATDPKWLMVGSQVGQLANIWAGRSDLVGYVGPGAGGIAPACFTPATAEVEVNVDIAFGKGIVPSDIGDLRERSQQFEWPRAVGAIFHEALHARYSTWDIEAAQRTLTPAEFRALVLLEEGRIESQGLQIYPENAGFLRACVLQIVLADLEDEPLPENSQRAAAALAALTLARVDAGSVEAADTEGIMVSVVAQLGEDTLGKLRDIWLAAQSHDKHADASELYELARKWVALLNEVTGEEEEDEGGNQSGGMSAGELTDLLDALGEAAEIAELGSYEQLVDQQTTEEWKEEAKSRQSKAKEQKEHEQLASDCFSKGTGPMPETRTRSALHATRPPTGEERAAAVKVAQMLDKAKYRDRDEVDIHSILPPGRLRTRAMVQGAALKAKGVMSQAEPWRRTVRKHVDDPTLTIGVMVDISGSMSEAMEPMAVTAWVMSEAVRRVQGRAAMVYYGEAVFPTLKPGQHLSEVTIYTAPDGTEKFDSAFKALNGGLNLLNGTGARLLVVVSDGCYTGQERQAAKHWLNECKRAGVGVLWLSIDPGHHAQTITRDTGAVLLPNTSQPTAVATEIGSAAARALTSVG